MSERKELAKRAVLAIPYLPAYYFVLYPLSFFSGLVLAILGGIYTLITGKRVERKQRATSEFWNWTSRNVDYILSGNGEFQFTPVRRDRRYTGRHRGWKWRRR